MSVNITGDSIQEFSDQLQKIEGQVVVDFWATWCGPCRVLSPILDNLEKAGDVTVVKVDVDQNPTLAQQFGVSSIPTMDFYAEGKTNKERLIGAFPEHAIKKHIQ